MHWTCETPSMRVFLRKHHTIRVDWTSMLTGFSAQSLHSQMQSLSYAHDTTSGLNFVHLSIHTESFHLVKFFLPPHNVLVSAPQLSGVMIIAKTSSLPQLATSSLLSPLDVHQSSSNHQYNFRHCSASIVFLLFAL